MCRHLCGWDQPIWPLTPICLQQEAPRRPNPPWTSYQVRLSITICSSSHLSFSPFPLIYLLFGPAFSFCSHPASHLTFSVLWTPVLRNPFESFSEAKRANKCASSVFPDQSINSACIVTLFSVTSSPHHTLGEQWNLLPWEKMALASHCCTNVTAAQCCWGRTAERQRERETCWWICSERLFFGLFSDKALPKLARRQVWNARKAGRRQRGIKNNRTEIFRC